MSRNGRPGGECMAVGHALVMWVALAGGSGEVRESSRKHLCGLHMRSDQHTVVGKAITSPIAGTGLAASSVALVLAPSPEPARSAASSRLAGRQRTALGRVRAWRRDRGHRLSTFCVQQHLKLALQTVVGS
eukprot:scaffold46734_cov71-Phaeocystis_antarctica.AAC.2